jgi:replication factor A1
LYLQVLGSRKIAGSASVQDRYRLVVTDGISTHNFAMLATSLNPDYEAGKFSEFTIIRIDRYVPSKINRNDNNEKQVLILFDITPIHPGSEVGQKIETKVNESKQIVVQKENVNTNSRFMGNSTANQSMNASVSATGNLSEHLTMPIESLSPYQNKWVIKARVSAKSAIRSWSNAKGEGKLFSVDFQDESNAIKCTFFRDAVDRFYDMLEVDKVYYVSRCQLKPANKQYSSLNNDYEMTSSNETQIQLCEEDDCSSIPKTQYNLVPIKEITNKNANDIIDIIGICKEASPVTKFTSKNGKDLIKREITLIDPTNASIVLTLWGNDAETFNDYDNPVVLMKNAKIGEFNGGKTLSALSSTVMKTNPDMPEGHQLRGWFENGGAEGQFDQLSLRTGGSGGLSTEWITFHETKVRNLGQDKPAYFQTMAMVHTVRSETMMYKACSNNDCNKKVVDQNDGTYRCEKCNVNSTEFKWRLLANVRKEIYFPHISISITIILIIFLDVDWRLDIKSLGHVLHRSC